MLGTNEIRSFVFNNYESRATRVIEMIIQTQPPIYSRVHNTTNEGEATHVSEHRFRNKVW